MKLSWFGRLALALVADARYVAAYDLATGKAELEFKPVIGKAVLVG